MNRRPATLGGTYSWAGTRESARSTRGSSEGECYAVTSNGSRPSGNEPNRTIGNPMGKLIKGEIDSKEYVRQVNEKRERHGLPPLRPQTASGR